ncbi:MAG: hypothetical protein K9M45_00235 [Kiritimatiellales bacterium]|nr:hypothetical protein [Kiritimatiellales bacterium]
MAEKEKNTFEDIQVDAENLYKEESITDLKVGHIRKLTPIKPDGSDDESREAIFTATTNIMTPGGALPTQGDIEAKTLAEAVENFPKAINEAVEKLKADMLRMQQEQASQIITPDQLGGNRDIII